MKTTPEGDRESDVDLEGHKRVRYSERVTSAIWIAFSALRSELLQYKEHGKWWWITDSGDGS